MRGDLVSQNVLGNVWRNFWWGVSKICWVEARGCCYSSLGKEQRPYNKNCVVLKVNDTNTEKLQPIHLSGHIKVFRWLRSPSSSCS